mmetsp:Transcript_72238/g.188418  ORF Transcript_72238/g.188418 Transcript_72238/m.188418 type:complete len:257 (+) Transcript_72238:317-1087(+)
MSPRSGAPAAAGPPGAGAAFSGCSIERAMACASIASSSSSAPIGLLAVATDPAASCSRGGAPACADGVGWPPRAASGLRFRGGGSACRTASSGGGVPPSSARGVSGRAAWRPSATAAQAAASAGSASKAKLMAIRWAPCFWASAMSTFRLLVGTESMQPHMPPSRDETMSMLSLQSTCSPSGVLRAFSATKIKPAGSCSRNVLTPAVEVPMLLPFDEATPNAARASVSQVDVTFCTCTGFDACTTMVTLLGAIACI